MDRSTDQADDTTKVVCTFCRKKFSCERSLGGYIRIHMSPSEEPAESSLSSLSSSSSYEEEANVRERYFRLESAYPRKTKRFVDETLKQRFHHSETANLAMDDQYDTKEIAASFRRKRSKSVATKRISFGDSVSSLSEVEKEDEDEIVRTLLMLSKGPVFGKPDRSCLRESSSDNSSVVLEAKPFSGNPRITSHNNNNEFKTKKQGTHVGAISSDNLDSGFFINGPKNAESDVPVDGFHESHESEFVSSKKCSEKFNDASMKRSRSEFKTTDNTESERKSISLQKQSKYHICPICHKMFKSVPALSGHKRIHVSRKQENVGVMIIKEPTEGKPLLIDFILPAPESENE